MKRYPQGRERKCKVDDFTSQGVGSSWGVTVLVSREMERLTPDGESLCEAGSSRCGGLQVNSLRLIRRAPAWLSLHALPCNRGMVG